MQQILLVALGGSLGAIARYGMSTAVYRVTDPSFPWGTLAVNLAGSFFIGILAELFDAVLIPAGWRLMLAVGFLGAFTTFSTFSLETVSLLRDGEAGLALGNILANNVLAILFVAAGIFSARFILRLFS
jgi:CrcB protein